MRLTTGPLHGSMKKIRRADAGVPIASKARLAAAKRVRPKVTAIYQQVRDRICVLEYPPGMLLGEVALAKEFGVSRTPIRQVLQRLEFERLVETRNGVGTLVTGVDFRAFRDVYEMRLKVAELIGEMSPKRPEQSDVARVTALLRRVERLSRKRDPEEYLRIAHEHHDAIGRLIGNAALRSMYDLFYYQTSRIFLHLATDRWQQEVDAVHGELSEIARALRAGDVQAVGFIHRNYISLILRRLMDYVSVGDTPISHRKA
jgi:DNA-binding GntR family transcriptional regulator